MGAIQARDTKMKGYHNHRQGEKRAEMPEDDDLHYFKSQPLLSYSIISSEMYKPRKVRS